MARALGNIKILKIIKLVLRIIFSSNIASEVIFCP